MKAIIPAALVCGLCGLARAEDEDKADPVGVWKCEYMIGDMKRTADLTVTKDGDKLAGTMSWPDQKDETLKDVNLSGKELTFSAVRKFMGNEIPIDFKLKLDGDKFKGKAARSSEATSRSSTLKESGRRRTSSRHAGRHGPPR